MNPMEIVYMDHPERAAPKSEAYARIAIRRLVTLNLITIAQKKDFVHSSVQD